MKKIKSITLVWSLIFSLICILQTGAQSIEGTNLSHDLPNIVPPSPTVNSLMRFEEVPVNNYTGQPNITFPLVSKEIPGLTIPVALRYHSGGLKVDERSGWVGTGWALEGEIVISRTVRDLPDEIKIEAGAPFVYGILHSGYENLGVMTQNDAQIYNNPDVHNYMWYSMIRRNSYTSGQNFNGNLKGWYDKEYDLYQVNVLGKTARFIIVKEQGSNNLKVEMIENEYNLLIIPEYNSSTFQIDRFKILDTNNFTYILEAKELFQTYSVTGTIGMAVGSEGTISQNPDPVKNYVSAWKVTEIKKGVVNIANFTYTANNVNYSLPSSYVENTAIDKDYLIAFRLLNDDGSFPQVASYNNSIAPPKSIVTHTEVYATTQSLNKINFMDQTSIELISSATHPEIVGERVLNSVKLKHKTNTIKEFNLTYHTDLANVANRLYLTKIDEITENQQHTYNIGYNDFLPVPFGSGHKDLWGYYKIPAHADVPFVFKTDGKTANRENVKKGVIKSISYPTGGIKEFEFESNSFFHQGHRAFTDLEFKELNEDNWIQNDLLVNNQGLNNVPIQQAFIITDPTKAQIFLQFMFMGSQYPDPTGFYFDEGGEEPLVLLSLYKDGIEYDTFAFNSQTQTTRVINLEAGSYLLEFDTLSTTNAVQQANIKFKTFKSNISKEIYGGGLRIKSISFKENQETLYKKNFNYTKTNGYSSGAIDGFLTNYREYYKYYGGIYACAMVCAGPMSDANVGHLPASGGSGNTIFIFFFNSGLYCKVTETLNAAYVSKTNGSYVGYSEVKIIQDGNGHEKFHYTSPIDHFSYPDGYTHPFLPLRSEEFKQGKPLNHYIYDQQNRLLKSNTYTYKDFVETVIARSIAPRDLITCGWNQIYNNFNSYINGSPENIDYGGTLDLSFLDGNCDPGQQERAPFSLHFDDIVFSKMLLEKIETEEFFYNDIVQNSINTIQEFDYNTVNWEIKEKLTKFAEGNQTREIKQKYYYAVGDVPSGYPNTSMLQQMEAANLITTPIHIETYQNQTKLSTHRQLFKEWNNGLILVEDVFKSKGTHDLTKAFSYESFDALGNPLQVSMAYGPKISYIYDYYHQYPVAKIENKAYSAIPAGLINAIHTASSPTGSETQLQTDLANLRANSSMEGAMITTYTYKPLVGVSTITAPNGDRIHYFYDAFGRLDHIKDMEGNLIEEYEYHYRDN